MTARRPFLSFLARWQISSRDELAEAESRAFTSRNGARRMIIGTAEAYRSW